MKLPEMLLETITLLAPPTVIAVSGFGGSGKSSFASVLSQRIAAPVVGLDAFVTDRTLPQYARWEIMDFDRLERQVLRPFTAGRGVQYGEFDWASNAIGQDRELPPGGRIIVEGVGLFRPGLLKYFSFLIWVDCPLHEAIRRGKKRDREQYHTPQDEAWDGLWKENDEGCYEEYQPKEAAHFVFNNG